MWDAFSIKLPLSFKRGKTKLKIECFFYHSTGSHLIGYATVLIHSFEF